MIEAEPRPAQRSIQDHDGRLLTPVRVADFLQVKLRRVYDLVKARRLRAIRVGQQLRFRLRDVDAFVKRNATE